eukprot:6919139-Prymnesium_polylepis.1
MPPPSGGSRTSLRAAPLELPVPHVNSIAALLRHTPRRCLSATSTALARFSRHARRPVRSSAAEARLSAGAASEGPQHTARGCSAETSFTV